MAFVPAHPEKDVLKAAAPQVGLELMVYMVGQGFALLGQLVHQGRVVRLDELIEQCLLGLMALVCGVAKCMPINRGRLSFAWRQHTGLTPTSVVPKSRTMKQSVLAGNI